MIQRYESSKAAVKRFFTRPYDTPEQGAELIRAALTLCSLGYLNDSYPVSVFAENKTLKMMRYSADDQLSAFYDDLQQEVHALLAGHLVYRATEEPEVAAIEILAQMPGHERAACEKGKLLLEWHSKVLQKADTADKQSLVGA
ncbi:MULTISPECIES: hypothetical protein [Pseudomonas]|uniref:hypothetical protein n=1 Tax=Pseudomonas TaxID=286 RepID=UPI0005C1F9BE|nr:MULTISPECIES: hypothetical protein [Pseudomonas]KIU48806.1 hypothetical protein QV12_17325 [Pseudomonas putida]RRW61951.1 hypothetical protein EGJ51_11390 [Pseudomonas fulva]UJW20206.1 hypothetical protein L2Y89_14505 [Pseudomonas juntendi]